MRQLLLSLLLASAIALTGCDSGATADVKKSGDEVRKQAEGMSVAELEKRIGELEKMGEELTKKVGDKQPDDAQMQEMTKLIEVTGIYATELVKKKMK